MLLCEVLLPPIFIRVGKIHHFNNSLLQERYVASLMPLQRNISPHKGAPRLRPFDAEEFLKAVETAGPQLTTGVRGDWTGLYRWVTRRANVTPVVYRSQLIKTQTHRSA